MVFHGSKWGWRTTAARLLLAPLFAAGLAVPAVGQQPASRPAAGAAARTADPAALLKSAKEEAKAGRFDRAEELVRQADKANPTGKWGVFDDTPDGVMKDIRAARGKAGKAEAERLTKAAKDLYTKPAKTPAERAANLDEAYRMADRATALAGESDLLDGIFGDRPDKLRKEIDGARMQLRRSNPELARMPAPAAPTGTTGTTSTTSATGPRFDRDIQLASATTPAGPVSAGAKAAAAKLVAEGREKLKANDLVGARAKAAEAQKLKASFAANEDSPEGLVRDVLADGKGQVDMLVQEADVLAARKDYAKAEAALGIAAQISTSLGFPTMPVEEKLVAVKRMSGGALPATTAAVPPKAPEVKAPTLAPPAMPAPTLVTPPATPEVKAPAVTPPAMPAPTLGTPTVEPATPPPSIVPPVMLPGGPAPTVVTPPALTPPAMTPPTMTPPALTPAASLGGKKLLDQATIELRAGSLDMAGKLARQAYNTDETVKADAQNLLRLIDAERSATMRKEAVASVKAAAEYIKVRQYDQAGGLLKVIDPSLLPPDQQAKVGEMMALCAAEAAKLAPQVPAVEPLPGKGPPSAPVPAAPLAPTTPAPQAGLGDQVKALAEVEFQKLRSEGLEAQTKAQEAFNRGETDLAITMLTDFSTKVRGSALSASRQTLLLSGVDRRLETFRIMKRQIDFVTKEATGKKQAREQIVGRALAEQHRKEELAKKSKEVQELTKAHKYREAEALALQLKTLDPDDPTLAALYEIAKRQRRVDDFQKLKSDKEQLVLSGLNASEDQGPFVDVQNPIYVNVERARLAMLRGAGADPYIKTMTDAERQIELRLEKPMSVEFKQTPLREVISKLRTQTGLNIVTDDASIQDEQINIDSVMVTEEIANISTRNVLAILLEKARLKAVTEDGVVKVTTEKKAKGRLYTKVFSVMDLVTPIPDFHLAPHQDLKQAFAKGSVAPPWASGGGAQGFQPQGGLNGGQMVGGNGTPWAGSGGAPVGTPGGTLDNRPAGNLSNLGTQADGRAVHAAKLQEMVTKIVKPYSWDGLGGAGKLQYWDIGGALVVNQTADVIREVQDLLEALRRLQETSVAVEIRVISLSEAFFERVGVDFQMNVKTKGTESFERSLTSGQFRPEPFLNDIDTRGVTVGWNPTANGFTPDLDVPIRPNTFGLGLPPFGGYTGPGNGGLSLGLAFLNDIQVYMFMEAAQGDRRVNVMQAPKVTLFNGQTSTVFVSDVAFFTIGLSVINVGGQVVYLPTNVPIPIGSAPPPPGSTGGSPGVSVTIQAIVSADRRFVRMNLNPSLTTITSATVPLFPITTFITPVFEGGSQGVPIPFTQFFQQPSINEINVATTVAVPDGGTVVLGGLKTLSEGRNEFGPPVLSNIPYINRLFRNHGIGRETRHIMIMVTPRIIIQSEEEFNQTNVAPAPVPGIGGSQ